MMLDYRFEASAKITGYIISYSGLVSTISGFFVGRVAGYYSNDSKLLLHSAILQLIAIVLMAFVPALWMMAVLITPFSMANAVSRVCSINLTIERGHGHETGTLLGLGASVLSVARMLSPTLGGISQEIHIAGPSLVACVFAAIGVAVMIIVPQNQHKERPKSD